MVHWKLLFPFPGAPLPSTHHHHCGQSTVHLWHCWNNERIDSITNGCEILTAAPPNSLSSVQYFFPLGLKFKKVWGCRCCVFLTVLSEVLWPIISGVFSPNPNNLFSWFAPKTAATVTTLFSQTYNWQKQHRGVRCSLLPLIPLIYSPCLCLCLPSPYPHPPMSQGQRLEFCNFDITIFVCLAKTQTSQSRSLCPRFRWRECVKTPVIIWLLYCLNRFLSVKVLVGAFKSLLSTFSKYCV